MTWYRRRVQHPFLSLICLPSFPDIKALWNRLFFFLIWGLMILARSRQKGFISQRFVVKSILLRLKIAGLLDNLYAIIFNTLSLEIFNLGHGSLDARESYIYIIVAWTWNKWNRPNLSLSILPTFIICLSIEHVKLRWFFCRFLQVCRTFDISPISIDHCFKGFSSIFITKIFI